VDSFERVLTDDFALVRDASTHWHFLCGKTIVVTGAAGFIPSYLVEFLLSLPDAPRVIGIVRNRERALERFARYVSRTGLELREADVSAVPPVKEQIDIVIHAASQASPKFYGVDPVGTLSANVFGTTQYLELARANGALFVYFSTGDVYGNVTGDRIGESDYGVVDPADVRSCYGESKRMGENMCVSWHAQYGVATRIMRIFHTYGPGMRLDDGRVFADFVHDIVHSRDIIMKSDGKSIRAFCYLADAVNGYLTIIAAGCDSEPYNVGNEDAASSVADLARTLAGLFPEHPSRVRLAPRAAERPYMESPLSRVIPDTSKLRALGWKPNFDIHAGFRRTIESYLD
jgi:UDP-glucuronate decarboxylase